MDRKMEIESMAKELVDIVSARKTLEAREKTLKAAFTAKYRGTPVNVGDVSVSVQERNNIIVDDELVAALKERRLYAKVMEEKVSVSKLRGLMASHEDLAGLVQYSITTAVEIK